MHQYKDLSRIYSIPFVLARIPLSDNFRIYQEVDGTMIKVSSRRMQTFKKCGTQCYLCGLEATHFCMVPEDKQYHKLILVYNNEVEFTQDHVYPTALGGNNHLHNARTLCETCNHKKSAHLEGDYIMMDIRKKIECASPKKKLVRSKIELSNYTITALAHMPL